MNGYKWALMIIHTVVALVGLFNAEKTKDQVVFFVYGVLNDVLIFLA